MASACTLVMANDNMTMGTGLGTLRTRASSYLLMAVTLVCVCILVVCGVLVVREYSLSQSYEETDCHVGNITYARSDAVCMYCGGAGGGGQAEKPKEKGAGACVAVQFPCIHVGVVYRLNGTVRTALLHQDSLQATGAYSQVGV